MDEWSAPDGGSGLRVPPHSREAERSVLGAIMLSSEAVNEVLDRLHPSDFYVPAHQSVFEAVVTLSSQGQPVDAITVSEILRKNGDLDRVGGLKFLTDLSQSVATAANIVFYSEIVEDQALRRRLLAAGGEIGELATHDADDISLILDQAEQAVFQVSDRRVGEGLRVIGDFIHAEIARIEELEANDSIITGLSTGFIDLDANLAGLHPGNLIVIAARPGMGKSSLALNICRNVAVHGDGTVAIFSLEMMQEEIIQRLICSTGRIDSSKLRTGQLGVSLWPQVMKAAGQIYDAQIYVDESSQLTVTDIRAKCRRLAAKGALDLVMVDYLQLMQGRTNENRQQEISEISRGLKNLANELKVPIIAVSQLNRALEQRQDKRPQLGDLRESGAIEQDADVVMFVYRDDYYNPESEARGLAEINIAKHRAGATGRVMMSFADSYTEFMDFAREPGM
jgi:replicative DNA helicase